MTTQRDHRDAGDRIERLLDEIRAMTSPSAFQRVEDCLRVVVDVYGEGLRRIVDVVATSHLGSDEVAERLLADQLVESLLLLHGLHPEEFSTRVGKALERVRPYLGSHGGDIELVAADPRSGTVRLRLGGSCDGCPSSLLTVKLAVEGAIMELAPETTSIDVEGVVDGPRPHSPAAAAVEVPAPSWIPLGTMPELDSGRLTAADLPGAKVLLCRLGSSVYAYRDVCPSCGSRIEAAELAGDLLTCPSCAERYDVRLAGRSLGDRDLHLDPLPLLEDDQGIRIALGATA